MMEHHGAPVCKCGSRRTQRVGESALLRLCLFCGSTFAYRLHHGRLVPLALITALALDESRGVTAR
jgi:hypothetical protein